MLRRVVGLLLIAHGFAHASAGIWCSNAAGPWVVTPLWAMAMLGYIAAGSGVLGIRGLGSIWRTLVVIATVASLTLLADVGEGILTTVLIVDALVLMLSLAWSDDIERELAIPDDVDRPRRPAPRDVLAWTTLLYIGCVIVARPWLTTWGTTAEERANQPVATDAMSDPHYRIDNAIVVNAPATRVWSRAPEFAHFGFVSIERARVLSLPRWSTFSVESVGPSRSRVFLRIRGPGRPSLESTAMGPLTLLVFEPAHLMLQRAMLHDIKARAEGPPAVASH